MAGPQGRGRLGRERGGHGVYADAPVLLHRHAAAQQGASGIWGRWAGMRAVWLLDGCPGGRLDRLLVGVGAPSHSEMAAVRGEFPFPTPPHPPTPHVTHTQTRQDEESGLAASELTAAANGGDGVPQHRAIPLSTLDSFNGLSKNRVFEWHIKDYTVQRNKESTTILKDIGACTRLPVPDCLSVCPHTPIQENSHLRPTIHPHPPRTAGRAQNGTFNAIMGPSGCGKTSLLDCLALRNQTFTGALRLDGLPLTGSFFLNTGGYSRPYLMIHPSTRPPPS